MPAGLRDTSTFVHLDELSAAPATDLLAWYRMTFSVPATEPDVWVPWYLEIEATGNGTLYLNGQGAFLRSATLVPDKRFSEQR
jgi:hypothetical protein